MSLLLPQADATTTAKAPKVWVGEGLPTIPKRLHDKIIGWEFVDLAELKPAGPLDSLNPEPDPQKFVILPGLEVARAKKKQVHDIHTWIQCYAIYVAVMAKTHPEAVPDMLAYMLVIMRAQQEYEEPAWRLYDEAFRDKAASTGNKKWALIDPHIYNQIFTGRARKRQGCDQGQGDPRGGELGPAIVSRKHPMKGAVVPAAKGARPPQVCWDWNDGHCNYGVTCKYRHMCSICGGRHPQVSCGRNMGPYGHPSWRYPPGHHPPVSGSGSG